MLFKKRKKRRTKTNPNAITVNWILFGFVLLSLTQNYAQHQTLSPEENHEDIKKEIAEATPTLPIDLGNYKEVLFPTSNEMNIRDINPGRGEPLVCGQKASIAYTVRTNDETLLDDSATADKPLTFRVGEHKVMPAFEVGLVGMHKGGKRIVASSAADAYDAEGFRNESIPAKTRVVFDVDLLDIEPALPDTAENVFNIADVTPGSGKIVLCGGQAKVKLIVRNVEGKKIFDSSDRDEPIIFTVGKSEVFLGLEQGVIGMRTGAKRTLIVSPGFQKTLNGSPSKLDIPFPSKQTVLVDVESLP
jgi:FKBP-type peptidyl-prolyl cis-trans isomerase